MLLRAVEQTRNIEARTQGPGLLCRAMHIDTRLNGDDLLSDNFYIADEEAGRASAQAVIVKRPRVAVGYAKHWARRHLRFYTKGNPFVSRR